MLLNAIEWHPSWISYEWWTDIGTGFLSFLAAAIIGGITVAIAIRSHRLSQRIQREQVEREATRDTERAHSEYRARLLEHLERFVTAGLSWIEGAVNVWHVGEASHRAAQAAVQGRLRLLRAVARGDDVLLTDALIEAFTAMSESTSFKAHTEHVSELLDHATTLATDESRTQAIVAVTVLATNVTAIPKNATGLTM